MYCAFCGSSLPKGAKFCQACGAGVTEKREQAKPQAREVPLKVVKPVLIRWLLLVSYIPLQLNLAFVGGGAAAGFSFILLVWLGKTHLLWYPIIGFPMLFFIATPLVILFVKQKTYDLTDYRFFKDHLEYAEGFWTIEKRIVNYRFITEVTMRKSVMQRFYGLGTLYIAVPSFSPGIRGFSGITIADVKKPEKIYDEIQTIISK